MIRNKELIYQCNPIRPVWKPMHLQPVFSGCRRRGGAVSEAIFQRGLCLPSGTNLTKEEFRACG